MAIRDDASGVAALYGAWQGWSGDLRHFRVQAWSEDSDVAAVVTTRGGQAGLWTNLRHVHPGTQMRQVWYWAQHAAYSRPPMDYLYADELPDVSADAAP